METVSIGRDEARLELAPAATREFLAVHLLLPGLVAERDVYDLEHHEPLARFFEQLAESWRGWVGERRHASVEGDLEMVAVHEGRIRLAITLRRHTEPGPWTVHGEVLLDPGEELHRAAEEVRALITP